MRRLLLAIPALLALGCSDVLCENSSHVEIAAPGGERSAWVFVRSCRALAPNAVHVAILPAGSPQPEGAGNAFIVENGGGVSVQWQSEHELLVTHEAKGQIVLQEPLVNDVAITYRLE